MIIRRGGSIRVKFERTRHDATVTPSFPMSAAQRKRVDDAIARLKAVRKGASLGGLSWKALRDEGRR